MVEISEQYGDSTSSIWPHLCRVLRLRVVVMVFPACVWGCLFKKALLSESSQDSVFTRFNLLVQLRHV